MALRYLGCHPLSRTIFNVIITFLLTELHCGYDLPWTPQNIIPFGLSTGSRGHHYHHRFGRHYYQKFFCTVDRLFGFVDRKTQRHGTLKRELEREQQGLPLTPAMA
jgi:sterol desaturase/sphingolipid hydroxylase (fatty acid hydroxylase superfamily)